MLVGTFQFCTLVGISQDRFEQRRLRERASADLASSAENDGLALMPIAPLEHGQRGAYDGFDALRLRTVLLLEAAGMSFSAACGFVLRAGIAPSVMFPDGDDSFAAQWLVPNGDLHRVCGSANELKRAMPEAHLAQTAINLTSVRNELCQRAGSLLGLQLVGMGFEEIG